MAWDDLPSGWVVARLGDVAPVSGENVEPLDEPNCDFNYIGLENIESNTGRLINFAPTKGARIKSTKRRFTQQHVLYGKLRPYLNKVWLPTFEGICATDLLPLLPDQTVLDRGYLAAFLRSPFFVEYSKRHMTGTKMPRLRMPAFQKAQIPLPPLPEQRRIVARIEELTERIDAARRLRAEAAEEAAAILPTALAEVFGEAEERGWEKYRLADVALIGTPKGWKLRPKDGKIPFIEMADIDQETGLNSRYVWADYDKVSKGKVKFQSDAILVAKITPCTENNKTALAPEMPTDGGFATTEVFAVHPTGFTNRLYLLAFLRSPQVRSELVGSMTGSTGRQRVPKQALGNLEMPLPSLDEQRRIVAYLDAVQAKVETIRRYQEETREEIEVMTGAVLEGAFRGEL